MSRSDAMPAAVDRPDAGPNPEPIADRRRPDRAEPGPAAAPAEERGLSVWSRLKFELVRTFLALWTRLFSLSGLYWLGQTFGTCEYLLDYHRRRRVHRRLARIFPEGLSASRRRLFTWRYFRRVRCDKLIYLIMDKVPREKLLRRTKWHGREHLDAALARGKGAYIMLAHYGSHHVAGPIMALLGYRVAGVRDPKEAPIRRYVQQKYAEVFPEIKAVRVYFADTFPRQFYREFAENGVLCSALDIDRFRGEHLKTCPVTVFGQTHEWLTGTLQIALRCGATVMQGFVVSRRNYYFRWELSAPLIDPDAGRDEPELVARVMQQYASNIESHARHHPDHLMKI
ncbi:MAG: hypothetical protein U1A27_03845 [Phycisphaerae bacterium]